VLAKLIWTCSLDESIFIMDVILFVYWYKYVFWTNVYLINY
jgi:hypothetical protein